MIVSRAFPGYVVLGMRRLRALWTAARRYYCIRDAAPKSVPRGPALMAWRPGSGTDYGAFTTEGVHISAALSALATVPIAAYMLDGGAAGDADSRPPPHAIYYVKEVKNVIGERLASYRAQRWGQHGPYPPIVVSKEIGGPYCLQIPLPNHCHFARVIAAAIGAWEQDTKAIRVHTMQGDSEATLLSFVVDKGQAVDKGRCSLLLTCPKSGPSKLFCFRDEGFNDADVNTAVEAYKVAWSTASNASATAGIPELLESIITKSQGSFEGSGKPWSDRSDQWHSRGGPGAMPAEDLAARLQKLGAEVFGPSSSDEKSGWDGMAGYDEVKQAVEDNLIQPLKHPETFERIARSTRERPERILPRAVLFEGPPGTGKTLTARILSELTELPLVYVPVEKILTKWYGESEKNLSQIFEICDEIGGAIIFIDEIDALATSRDSGSMHEATRRMLSVILQKVEGFKQGSSRRILIGATNRKQDLDSALRSRFDTCIRFELPGLTTRMNVYRRYAKHLTDAALQVLSESSVNFSCRDIKQVCENAERRWASKLIKGEEVKDTPSLSEYLSAAHSRTRMVEHPEQHSNSKQQHDSV